MEVGKEPGMTSMNPRFKGAFATRIASLRREIIRGQTADFLDPRSSRRRMPARQAIPRSCPG
jgi:hypothetical protein